MKKIEASLIKKASKDQLTSSWLRLLPFNVNLWSVQFWSSLIILSLSHTLGYLEFSWSTLGGCGILGFLEQEGKGRARKRKRTLGSATIIELVCRY